jgi:serine/threonine protein kinase
MTEETIFATALEKPPSERAAYLDEACGNDEALRNRLEGLLAASEKVGNFMANPAVAPAAGSDATEALATAADCAVKTADPDEEALTFLAPPTRPDSLGRIGHYEVLQVLGRGGFGIVFRAFDEVLQRVVALKVMAPQLAATSPARKRFLREARSSAQVRHENVVQVYEIGEQPLPYLAMEFIPGETLQQRLDRVGPLDVPEVLRIGRQIAEGLAAAHATDLIHRDIKPGNVLLEAGEQKVKITDFGLARTADDASISQSGIIAGTPMYMAPEQAQGQTLDQRADLFSLGSVLYQMVAGRPPFRASTAVAVLKRVAEEQPRAIREIIPETPQWLCDIIAKLHAKIPDDRYQSAREVADVLADCEAQLKANAKLKDYSRILPSQPQPSERRKWVAAAAAVLLPVIALVVTEFGGVTHLFREQQVMKNPVQPMDDSLPRASDGWVQLFNGKDLSGWKTHPDQPGEWRVDGQGVLIGSGATSHLFSTRADYADFHLRAELRVNGGGKAGIYVRVPNIELPRRGGTAPRGILTVVDCADPNEWTGTLAAALNATGGIELVSSQVPPPSVGEWFILEVIAHGSGITTKVNGKTTAGYHRLPVSFSRGHITLQVRNPGPVIEFRKIEIKEQPASSPDAKPPLAVAPFTDADVQRIAALPAEQQVEEVRRELKRRNPGFDGKMETKIEGGVVTEFTIGTDKVTDIAPIRVFDGLRVLECRGTQTDFKPNGLLADLRPLEGMNLVALTHLVLDATKVSDAGLVHFKDCKNLSYIDLFLTQVSDAGLVHFRDCKALTTLGLGRTKITDAGLANFKDCKSLSFLSLAGTQVGDSGLAYFKDC